MVPQPQYIFPLTPFPFSVSSPVRPRRRNLRAGCIRKTDPKMFLRARASCDSIRFPFCWDATSRGSKKQKTPRTTKITTSHHRPALEIVPTLLLCHPAVPRTNIRKAKAHLLEDLELQTLSPCHPAIHIQARKRTDVSAALPSAPVPP
jgi:hypothetical protein